MKFFKKQEKPNEPKEIKKTGWRDYIEVYKVTFLAISVGYLVYSILTFAVGKQVQIVGANETVLLTPVQAVEK